MYQPLLDDVLEDCATNRRYRVVQITDGVVILFELPPDPYSQCRTLNFCDYPIEKIQKWVDVGKLKNLDSHPYHPPLPDPAALLGDESIIGENSLIIRDRRVNLVNKAIPENLSVFVGKGITQHLKKVCQEHGGSRTGLGKFVGRFYALGRVPNALLPTFGQCGGRGKPKPIGHAKRGAQCLVEGYGGINITPEIATKINEACVSAIKAGLTSVPEIYRVFNEKHFVDGRVTGNFGETQTKFLPPHMRVKFDSFEKRFHQIDFQMKTIGWWGETEWTKSLRSNLGSVWWRAYCMSRYRDW